MSDLGDAAAFTLRATAALKRLSQATEAASFSAVDWSIAWWRMRHDLEYFPAMEQHLNWKVYEAMIDWWLVMAEPRPDDDALEIGCGYGEWMVPCARLVRSVKGFDIHPALLEKAQEALAGSPNAEMVLGDGQTIPFPAESFSLVFAISVFQHMPRAIVHGYLRETARVLRPEGRAVLHFRHADGHGPYAEDIVVNHTGDFSVGWSVREGYQAVDDAGLRVTDMIAGPSLILRVTR